MEDVFAHFVEKGAKLQKVMQSDDRQEHRARDRARDCIESRLETLTICGLVRLTKSRTCRSHRL
jgi:type IV secretory pathway VirD2 relaxase